jgi:hypothetical protein
MIKKKIKKKNIYTLQFNSDGKVIWEVKLYTQTSLVELPRATTSFSKLGWCSCHVRLYQFPGVSWQL